MHIPVNKHLLNQIHQLRWHDNFNRRSLVKTQKAGNAGAAIPLLACVLYLGVLSDEISTWYSTFTQGHLSNWTPKDLVHACIDHGSPSMQAKQDKVANHRSRKLMQWGSSLAWFFLDVCRVHVYMLILTGLPNLSKIRGRCPYFHFQSVCFELLWWRWKSHEELCDWPGIIDV